MTEKGAECIYKPPQRIRWQSDNGYGTAHGTTTPTCLCTNEWWGTQPNCQMLSPDSMKVIDPTSRREKDGGWDTVRFGSWTTGEKNLGLSI